MKTKIHFALLSLSLIALAAPAHAVTIIYQDDFSGDGSASLFGNAPNIRPTTETWSGSTLAFKGDGSVANEGARGVWLPFVPAAGNIYQLSGSITTIAGEWITLGFTVGNPDANFNTIAAEPYGTALVAVGGGVTFFDGQGLNGGTGHPGSPGANEIDIIFDTTNANSALWTMALILNGTPVVGPNPVTDSGTWPAAGNLDRIQFVGFSVSAASGQISDFSLSIIPEPSSALLGVLGILALLRRRRN